MQIWDTAG